MIKLYKKNLNFFIIIPLIFIISANIAWLNPGPGKEVYKPFNELPLLWQYNYDSGIEILTAAYFPSIFKTDNTRIDRPTYPFFVKIIGELVGLISQPIYKLNNLEKAGIGYLLLKLTIYGLAFFCSQQILSN